MKQYKVIKHISSDELKQLIQKEKNKYVHERLLFINHLFMGDKVIPTCKRLCVTKATGYYWLAAWNSKGYEGLIPNFGGGRPPKLTNEEKAQLKEKLKSKDNWTTPEVKAFIKRDFGIEYSERHIARMLKGFGMHYAKPYPQDYRKPENAKELLKRSIKEGTKDIKEKCVVGFLDQTSPQTTDNKQRFWSFNKPRIIKNTTKIRANTFGFYPINGNSVVEFMKRSTIPRVCEFFRHIRDRNPGKRIVVFLDNFGSHISGKTKAFAESLNITLIFIPVHSPDLNPIEPLWKSLKKMISKVSFIRSEWSFKETIRTNFHRLARKKSFMTGWLKEFQPLFSNLL